MSLRGETPSTLSATTWRTVTDDCRVRHVEGPATVDVRRERVPIHLALVLRGPCRLRRADGTVEPLPDSALVIEPDSATLEIGEGARVGLASLRSIAAGPSMSEVSPELRRVSHIDPALTHLVESVMVAASERRPTGTFARHIIDRTVRDLIGGLILDGQLRPTSTPRHSLHAGVVHHIADHYADADLGPETIAAAFSISPRHLARILREHGTSVSESIASARVNVATALISQHPELSLAEVGAQCGFPSQQAMRRAFRAVVHRSPAEIRTLSARRHAAATRSQHRGTETDDEGGAPPA